LITDSDEYQILKSPRMKRLDAKITEYQKNDEKKYKFRKLQKYT
jgi:hypothetical protein